MENKQPKKEIYFMTKFEVEQDGQKLEICDVIADFTDDKPYFRISLQFPNGSWKDVYISYNALQKKDNIKQAK